MSNTPRSLQKAQQGASSITDGEPAGKDTPSVIMSEQPVPYRPGDSGPLLSDIPMSEAPVQELPDISGMPAGHPDAQNMTDAVINASMDEASKATDKALKDVPEELQPLVRSAANTAASAIAGATAGLLGGAGLPANATWFNFTTAGGPFAVYEFHGLEEVHKPYEFTIELVSTSSALDITGLIGQTGCLTIMDRSGETRPVHGLIRQMEQLHTANRYTHYRCHIVPRLWFLNKIIDHRIFQNKKVDEIIEQILKEQGFAGETFEFQLAGEYEPREYCVQYGETDLHFISRLCEEEGIYFYHEHTLQSHKLCFCDKENGPPIPGNPLLRYFRGSGNVADTAVVSAIALRQRVNSNAVAYREWNFKKPRLDQEVKKDETDPQKAPVPQGMLLEQYRYPHLYREPQKGGEPGTPGQRYADVQLLRQLTFSKYIEGTTDVARMVPSFVFTLSQHPRLDINAPWWVVRTEHHGEQPGVLQHEAPSERGMDYRAYFTAIPAETRYVPEADHPKRRAVGDQTAIVTGPEGEEIYPDKYGRVKVQFFWDREGKWDENSTCWIRVSQGWAGSTYGTIAIPRIGHEVIVRFLEGDPDRPLITGRVYHELNMPPYELPEHKTRTVFKSMSTPGEEGEARGYNELRIEDKKDNEEIYVHAQKDVNIHVKNDWKEHILHDKHETIDASRYTHIKGEEHLLIEKDRMTELKEKDHFTVHNDSHSEYKTKWLAKAGEEIHFKSGDKVVFEAGSDMTIKGGDSFIRLTPAGIVILGSRVKINEGGSPGSGTGAAPELPDEAVKPGEAPKPKRTRLKLKDGEMKQENGSTDGSGADSEAAQAQQYEKAANEANPFAPACELLGSGKM